MLPLTIFPSSSGSIFEIQIDVHLSSTKRIRFLIDIFYLKGGPILQHLLRYSEFAVEYHTFIRNASHLLQPRPVNNPSSQELFIKNVNVTINYFHSWRLGLCMLKERYLFFV